VRGQSGNWLFYLDYKVVLFLYDSLWPLILLDSSILLSFRKLLIFIPQKISSFLQEGF